MTTTTKPDRSPSELAPAPRPAALVDTILCALRGMADGGALPILDEKGVHFDGTLDALAGEIASRLPDVAVLPDGASAYDAMVALEAMYRRRREQLQAELRQAAEYLRGDGEYEPSVDEIIGTTEKIDGLLALIRETADLEIECRAAQAGADHNPARAA